MTKSPPGSFHNKVKGYKFPLINQKPRNSSLKKRKNKNEKPPLALKSFSKSSLIPKIGSKKKLKKIEGALKSKS